MFDHMELKQIDCQYCSSDELWAPFDWSLAELLLASFDLMAAMSFHNHSFVENSQTFFKGQMLSNFLVNFACLNDGNGKQQPLHPPQQHLTQPKLQVHIRAIQNRT